MSYLSHLTMALASKDVPNVVRKYHDKARQQHLYQQVRSHLPEWMVIYSRYHGEKPIEQKAREIKQEMAEHPIWSAEIQSLSEHQLMGMLFVTCDVQVTPRRKRREEMKIEEITGCNGVERGRFRIRRKPLPTGRNNGPGSRVGLFRATESSPSSENDEIAEGGSGCAVI